MLKKLFFFSAKNYLYDLHDIVTDAYVKTVTKIRGFTLTGNQAQEMDSNAMAAMIQALQKGQLASKAIPQFTLKIQNKKKTITSETVAKVYFNIANTKKFPNFQLHPSKLFAYGTTTYK